MHALKQKKSQVPQIDELKEKYSLLFLNLFY